MTGTQILVYWLMVALFGNLLVVSIIMLWTGKFPPPMGKKKASPLFSTALHVIAMTGTLYFGQPDLLKNTLALLFP